MSFFLCGFFAVYLQDMGLSYVPQVLAVSSHTMSVVLVDIEICRGNCGKDR